MNKLIKMATMVACAVAMLGIVGCGAKAPDEVALDVLKALQEGKADQAFLEKTCTKETAGVFAMFGGMMKDATKGATWSVTQTYIDDDIATVMITQSGGKKSGEEAYYLKKIDGQWKLHMDKEDPGKDMISKKTAEELLQAFKNDALITFNEQELSKKATPEFIASTREMFGRMSEKDKEELKDVTFTVTGTKIKKRANDSGIIEFTVWDGRKNEKDRLLVKRVNGAWKLHEFH